MDYGTAIPGYECYTIKENGNVYHNGRLLKHLKNKARSERVKLKNNEGKLIRIAVAKLIAITFIPNLNHHTKIIFKDRDKSNCTASNIQWVSAAAWCRFVNHHAESEALLGPPKPKRQPDWIDPARVPLNGYPGYYSIS